MEIARESKSSTSASDSFAPSMRVEEPTLSMVATLRSALRRSGESVLRASHLPLNSSISAMSFTRSGPNASLGSLMAGDTLISDFIPNNTRLDPIFHRRMGPKSDLALKLGASARQYRVSDADRKIGGGP